MRTAIPLTVLATLLVCSLASAPAYARARVFVASYGNDSNPCTFGSPCKTFQVAVNVVDPGGEVTAIDSAGFGPINITKAVTITSPAGIEAGIVLNSVGTEPAGITINAGASDIITLRGLTVQGNGSNGNQQGVVFENGAALHIHNCVFNNLTFGIAFDPNNTDSDLFVSDTSLADNSTAISVESGASGEFTAVLNRVTLENNNTGIFLSDFDMSTGALDVTISDSVIARNSGIGVDVIGNNVFVIATILNSRIVNGCDNPCSRFPNSIGVKADGGFATIALNGSAILQNATGWVAASGGHVQSYGNNQIEFNPAGNTTPPSALLK